VEVPNHTPVVPRLARGSRAGLVLAGHNCRLSTVDNSSANADDPLADSRRSLATGVGERIEALILGGDLKPGQRINEVRLAAELRVSRAPIREACRRLERHGLVEMRPNRGAFVCTLDARDIAELYDLRAALEDLVGRRAAERCDAARLDQLAAMVAEMARLAGASPSREYFLANQRFHAAIVAAAASRHLADAYAGAAKRLALYRIGHQASPADMATSLAEHQGILAALRARDPAAAGRALADHCRSGYHRHLGAGSIP
jgi:DNA-binding GntR family transcriptional regulator